MHDAVRFARAQRHPLPGTRQRGELRGRLLPRHHRGRSGEARAAVRALSLRGARRRTDRSRRTSTSTSSTTGARKCSTTCTRTTSARTRRSPAVTQMLPRARRRCRTRCARSAIRRELAFAISKRVHDAEPTERAEPCARIGAKAAARRRRRRAAARCSTAMPALRRTAAAALHARRRLRALGGAARQLSARRADDDGAHDPPVRQGRPRHASACRSSTSSGSARWRWCASRSTSSSSARATRPRCTTCREDDAKTYEMIPRGETIGTFQIESRAQIDSILHTKPEQSVRHRRAGGAHPPGADPGEVRPPVHRAAARARAGDRIRIPSSSRSCGARRASRSSRSRRWRSRWCSAATRRREADELRRTMGQHPEEGRGSRRRSSGLKRAMVGARRRSDGDGSEDLRGPRELRELRLSRIARLELRADRLRDGVPQGAPPDGVLRRAAQRAADGVLFRVDAGARREAARRRGAASLPARRELGLHERKRRADARRVAVRPRDRRQGARRVEGGRRGPFTSIADVVRGAAS